MGLNNLSYKLITRSKVLFSKTNRSLLRELVRAEFKLNDQNSVLGLAWGFINPALMLLVMYFIFKIRFGHTIYAYPLYLLIGISSVNFFITMTNYATRIFAINRDFVLNTTLPREMIILSRLFIYTYKFVIELLLCLVLSLFYGVFPGAQVLLLLPLLLSYMALALGFSFLLSLVYCFIRDIDHIWMLLSRLFLFVTPIFYELGNMSLSFRQFIYWANPLTPFAIAFQEIIMKNNSLNIYNYSYAMILGVVSLVLSYSVFLTVESFALERA